MNCLQRPSVHSLRPLEAKRVALDHPNIPDMSKKKTSLTSPKKSLTSTFPLDI